MTQRGEKEYSADFIQLLKNTGDNVEQLALILNVICEHEKSKWPDIKEIIEYKLKEVRKMEKEEDTGQQKKYQEPLCNNLCKEPAEFPCWNKDEEECVGCTHPEATNYCPECEVDCMGCCVFPPALEVTPALEVR